MQVNEHVFLTLVDQGIYTKLFGHRVNTKSYTPHAESSLIYQGRFAFTTQLREKEKLISETIGLKNHG